jgi:hypothetical protein
MSCDESFEPLAPTDLAFSVFGYLDASADTQWIRIMPIRPLKTTSRGALAATVTLEHIETGRIVELQDSLFRFTSPDPEFGSEGVFLHNFWTTEPIEPGATYRFSARTEGKDPAEAIVEIPLDYDVEVAINQSRDRGATDELRTTGVKYLPFVTSTTYFYDGCGSNVVGGPHQLLSANDEMYVISIQKPAVAARPGCGLPMVENRDLFVVGSGMAWPTNGYSSGALGESGRTSNVTNAVGFLGGVLTKVIPYEECQYESGAHPIPDYCRLRYNQETASLFGTVRETFCGDGPRDSVIVRLNEMDRDPARIRTVLTTRAGTYTIGALEPGIPHFLWVRAPQVPIDSVFDLHLFRWVYTEWEDVHTLPTDTLTFLPGEQLEYDIDLRRLTPCSEPPPRP